MKDNGRMGHTVFSEGLNVNDFEEGFPKAGGLVLREYSSAQHCQGENVYCEQYMERRTSYLSSPKWFACKNKYREQSSRYGHRGLCCWCCSSQQHNNGTSSWCFCYGFSLVRFQSKPLFSFIQALSSKFMIKCLFFLSKVYCLAKPTFRFLFYVTLSQSFPSLMLRNPNSAQPSFPHPNKTRHIKSRSHHNNREVDNGSQGNNLIVIDTPPSLKKGKNYQQPPTTSHWMTKLHCRGGDGCVKKRLTQFRSLLCHILLLLVLPIATSAYELKPTTTVSRVTLAGEKAKLPCELPLPEDRPTLILWYKDHSTKPFYSYDARETASGRHKIHDNSDLATRSRFTLEKVHQNSVKTTRLGFLEVEGVMLADAGNYTCRVDFMTSQTMMALLKVTVHEEIRGLEVYDAYGTMVSKIVGPYQQSTRVILSCRAYGGYPPPVVQWMAGDMVLKSSNDPGYTGPETTLPGTRGAQPLPMVNVMLHMSGLRREDNGKEIKCVAFNTNLTQPRSRVLTIKVYLPPLEVKVEGLEKPLLAGMESMLLCRATGSRPPATLTWKLEGSSGLTPLPVQSSLDQNTTLGRGRLLPTPEDNGRTLTCTASNPEVPEYKKEDSHKLQVYFAPEVQAKLAPALDPKNIKEGEDVYFECVIRANPPESRVIWLHEGHQLHTDLQLGILAQGKNLVLQKVSRHSRGKYQCRVTNSIDTVTSSATSLNVMFVPECSGQRNVTVSVTPTEEVKLNCLVESNPEDVNFVWKVNSSRGVKELDSSNYKSQGRASILLYKPSDHAIANDQYGVVFCQGFNRLGAQKLPCMFIISPAGPPEDLQSCVLRNQSATSLAVICQPGHDGGLKQRFIATIQDAENGDVVANLTSDEPQFSVGGLAPGRDYLVMVKASNTKGSSEPYLLEGFALKVHEIKINNSSSDESSPLMAVFVGVISGFILIFIILGLVNRARGRRRREQAAGDTAQDKKLSSVDDMSPPSPSTKDSLDGMGEDDLKLTEVKTPDSLKGQMVTAEIQSQTLTSPGSMTSRTYLPSPGGAGHTGSLPRAPHLQQSRQQHHQQQQPLHSDDLPHMTSSNHKYYTLKINCTRQNNESFV